MKSTLARWDSSDKTNIEKNGNVNIQHLQADEMDISTKNSKKMFFITVTCTIIMLKELKKNCSTKRVAGGK